LWGFLLLALAPVPLTLTDEPVVLPAAPAVSPPIAEVPVPLNVVGPPAVPFELCANTKVLDNANAVASARVTNFMIFPFHALKVKTRGRQRDWWCNVARYSKAYRVRVSSVYAKTEILNLRETTVVW
jgi:hypothetical protein